MRTSSSSASRIVGASIFVLCTALFAARAQAVILYAKADRNTRPPHASLVNSGWQWQGQFGSFLGTPISRNHFITSGHVGGEPGQMFVYNGQKYLTTAYYDDPATDLRIWKVEGSFESFAPVFKDDTEIGRSCVIFGRGTQRGAEVFANGERKGWQWGTADNLQSWGRNAFDGIVDGGPQRGDLLYFSFDQIGTSHEGMLSAGDSGGGVFVRHGSRWKLAGINTSTDGPYAFGPGQDRFNASLFDKGGMFVAGINNDETLPDVPTDQPSLGYVTRISTNLTWINEVLTGKIAPGATLPQDGAGGVPEPTGALITLLGVGAAAMMRRHTRPSRARRR